MKSIADVCLDIESHMRIAFLTSEYVSENTYAGGLANYLHRTSLALMSAGHEPHIVVTSESNGTIQHDGIAVHRVAQSPHLMIRGLSLALGCLNRLLAGRFWMTKLLLSQSLVLNRRLKELHRQNPFSLVQYPHLNAIGFFRPAAIPCVTRLSSYTPLWKEKGEYPDDAFMTAQLEFWERLAMEKTDALFGPCKIIADRVSHDLSRPVSVIETPYFPEQIKYDSKPYQDLLAGRDYLLFCGRLSPAKGTRVLAEAIPTILERHPQLTFVFVGREQSAAPEKSVMQLVWQRAGSRRGRILFLGSMRHDQLYPILQNAVAVLLPSLIENFPNICLEAMAHQRIVIGTYHTSFEQILDDGISGFLCEPGDPADLSRVVDQVLSLDISQRMAIGARAALRLNDFAPEKTVTKLLSLYNDVINTHAQRRRHYR
jgi:glycosyltransferase involved in cell wall biosynthesis